jgi:D-alanyl-D-alanine carboxypeptidase
MQRYFQGQSTMYKKLCAILILFYGQLVFASQPDINPLFQKAIDDFRTSHHLPSATLTISYPDESSLRHFVSGTVTKDSDIAINNDHLFQVGSITKSFIASIILKMQSQGKLHLDDPFVNYLPEYSQWNGVTIRQLLNHTSGIFNYTESMAFRTYLMTHPYDYITPDQLIDYAAAQPKYFEAGSGWHYSNSNYVLLGKLIERIEHKSIDDLMNQYLLSNINLTNSFFVKHLYSETIQSRMMHGYYVLNANHAIDITNFSMSWLSSAGGIVSNGNDLTQWILGLFNGTWLNTGELREFTQLVSRENGQPIDGVNADHPNGYGLGIYANKSELANIDMIWWHSGGTTGYKTLMMWLPKQRVALTLNYTQINAGEENIPFDPSTPLAQEVLKLISNQNRQG